MSNHPSCTRPATSSASSGNNNATPTFFIPPPRLDGVVGSTPHSVLVSQRWNQGENTASLLDILNAALEIVDSGHDNPKARSANKPAHRGGFSSSSSSSSSSCKGRE